MPIHYTETVARRKTKGTLGGWRPGAGRKPTLEDPVSVTLDLERRQKNALEAIAEHRDVSVAALIRKAVDGFLKRQKRS